MVERQRDEVAQLSNGFCQLKNPHRALWNPKRIHRLRRQERFLDPPTPLPLLIATHRRPGTTSNHRRRRTRSGPRAVVSVHKAVYRRIPSHHAIHHAHGTLAITPGQPLCLHARTFDGVRVDGFTDSLRRELDEIELEGVARTGLALSQLRLRGGAIGTLRSRVWNEIDVSAKRTAEDDNVSRVECVSERGVGAFDDAFPRSRTALADGVESDMDRSDTRNERTEEEAGEGRGENFKRFNFSIILRQRHPHASLLWNEEVIYKSTPILERLIMPTRHRAAKFQHPNDTLTGSNMG